MGLRLVIEDDQGSTTIVPLGPEPVTIGRTEGNTIQLTEKNVSRRHARLWQEDGAWFVEDLESYNGVRVNGERLSARTRLHAGDVIQIGDYQLGLADESARLGAATLPAANQTGHGPGRTLRPEPPLLASSSAELPRLDPAALGLAGAAATGGAGQLEEDELDRPRRGAGPWIAATLGVVTALGLVGAVALGLVPGLGFPTAEPPAMAEAPAVARADGPRAAANSVAAAAEPGAGADAAPAAADPAVAGADPAALGGGAGDPAALVAADGAVADDDGPGVAPADPNAAGDAPGVAVAADNPDAPADPVPEPTAPATAEPTAKAARKPAGNPDELLAEARRLSLANQPREAYDLAKQAYRIDRSPEAAKLMAVAACKLKDERKAKAAVAGLRPADVQAVRSLCANAGVVL